MKTYKLIKLIIFVITGTLIIVFSEFFLENIKNLYLLVGSVMSFYGLEAALLLIIEKEFKEEKILFLNSIITLFLGLLVIFMPETTNSLVVLSVLWSVWAIMRESEEIFEKVLKNWNCKVTSILNLLESLVVIVFSVMLILNPSEHHLHSHVILLGIELILEETFPLLTNLEANLIQKKEN